MKGHWSVCVSVNAQQLASPCRKLKVSDTIRLIYAAEVLILNDGAFTLSAKSIKRPERLPS